MLDLAKLPAYYLEKYGRERVAEVTGKTPAVIAMWSKGENFTVPALQALLEFDPSPLADIKPLYTNPAIGTKLVILMPLTGAPQPKALDSLMRLYDRREMSYERFAFNCLSVSRNALAARWLRGTAPWAWWMDADSMLPAGDSEWFKREAELPDMPDAFAGVHSIYRALVHEKTIVSCAYVSRSKAAVPQFGGGERPEIRALIRRGPIDRLIEAPWSGMGGMLTHRSVFEDIVKTQGDEIRMKPDGIGKRFNYQYAFFDPIDRETPGDDVPWCHRATRAGHKVYVDLAIHAAHIGDRAYTYADL